MKFIIDSPNKKQCFRSEESDIKPDTPAIPSVRARSRLHGLAALRNPDVWKHDGMTFFSVSYLYFLGAEGVREFRELQGKSKMLDNLKGLYLQGCLEISK